MFSKMQMQQVKTSMSDADYDALKEGKGDPRNAFLKLIELCQTSLDDAVADFKSEESKGVQHAAFEFYENDGSWVAITDGTVVGALNSLMQNGGSKVSYSFGGHNYEASFARRARRRPAATTTTSIRRTSARALSARCATPRSTAAIRPP